MTDIPVLGIKPLDPETTLGAGNTNLRIPMEILVIPAVSLEMEIGCAVCGERIAPDAVYVVSYLFLQ